MINELSKLIPRHTEEAIRRQRKRLGVQLDKDYLSKVGRYRRSFVDENNLCKLDQSLTLGDLDNITKQVLFGSILGDGCIKKNSLGKNKRRWKIRNYLFYEGHRGKQTDYVKWKMKMLSVFLPKYFNGDGGRPEMWTVSHPIFSLLREKFYHQMTNSRKGKVPLDLLEDLDLLGLMVWYLDDGNIGMKKDGTRGSSHHAAKPNLSISAKLFDYDGLVSLCESLNKRFSLSLHVVRNKHRDGHCNSVKFRRRDFRIVIPSWRMYAEKFELPKCMFYKLNMHDENLRAIENLDMRFSENRKRCEL